MKKLVETKFIHAIIIIVIASLPAIFFIDLKFSEFNIWMDFSGVLNILENFSQYLSVWNSNLLGNFSFTTPASLPFFVFLTVIYKVFGLEHGTYFVFYFSILFVAISGYLLSNSILEDRIKSLLITPIFIFNPILMYYAFSRGTVTFLIAFAGLLLSYLCIYKYVFSNKRIFIFGLIISSLLVTHPFIFFFLVVLICYYFLINKKYQEALFVNTSIFLINSFWIIPFISSFLFKGRDLLGSYSVSLAIRYAYFGDFTYSFVFLGRSIGLLNQMFGHYQYIYIIAFFSLWIFAIYYSLFKKRKLGLKYWVLILFLLLFSLGPRGDLGTVYRYFLENFKLFSFFRSYQNILIILSSFLFFYSLMIAKKYNNFLKILQVISLIAFFSFILFRDSTFTSKSIKIPDDYFLVKNIVDRDNLNSKVFLLPHSIYDIYKWDINQDKYFLQYFFRDKGLVFLRPTIDDEFLENFYNNLYEGKVKSIDFAQLGIKYIINRKDLNYAERGYFRENFSQLPGDLILETENLDLYSIAEPDPLIQLNNSFFKKNNQSQYRIYVKSLLTRSELFFLEQFHSGWKIYIDPLSSSNLCQPSKLYEKFSTTECSADYKLYKDEELSYLYKKPIFDDTHRLVNGYANGWTIDPEYIKQNFSQEYYKENPDGSIDIELTLYFKPQSYFYLGLIISGTTLLGCFGYIGYDFIRRRRRREEEGEVVEEEKKD